MIEKCPDFTVAEEHAGMRLDAAICRNLGGELSRARARKLCEEGMVQVNGKPAVAGRILVAGDNVRLLGEIAQPAARADVGKLADFAPEILYQDEFLLIVSKPREVHSVTLHSTGPATLADWLSAYAPSCVSASPDQREAGLVQRLDYFTSGAIIAAKTPDAWQKMRALLSAGAVKKTYLALVEGIPEHVQWQVDLPLYSSGSGQKVAVVLETTRIREAKKLPAETSFVCLEHFSPAGPDGALSLVRATAASARRHQVRAHLAASGHPLAGDSLYGAASDSFPAAVRGERQDRVTGFFLHALTISFMHPMRAVALEITANTNIIETSSYAGSFR